MKHRLVHRLPANALHDLYELLFLANGSEEQRFYDTQRRFEFAYGTHLALVHIYVNTKSNTRLEIADDVVRFWSDLPEEECYGWAALRAFSPRLYGELADRHRILIPLS